MKKVFALILILLVIVPMFSVLLPKVDATNPEETMFESSFESMEATTTNKVQRQDDISKGFSEDNPESGVILDQSSSFPSAVSEEHSSNRANIQTNNVTTEEPSTSPNALLSHTNDTKSSGKEENRAELSLEQQSYDPHETKSEFVVADIFTPPEAFGGGAMSEQRVSTSATIEGTSDSSIASPGILRVYVDNVDGSSVAGATVVLYDSGWNRLDEKKTNSYGVAYFSLSDGKYFIEVYYDSPAALGYTEFWGGDEVWVSGSSTYFYFTRHTQWAYEVKVNNQYVPTSVDVYPGDKIHVDVKAKNSEVVSKNVRVTVILDRNKSPSWDLYEEHGPLYIGSNSYGYFGWDYYPSYIGTYYIYVIVKGYYNGRYIITDQFDWTKAFVVSEPDYNEEFYSVEINPFDESGDGLNDAVQVKMDVDTTGGTLLVDVNGYLYDPSGSFADSDSSSWWITGNNYEYGYIYLYAPSWSSEGWYDIDLYLYDDDGNYEDFYSASAYLYPWREPKGKLYVEVSNNDDDSHVVDIYVDGGYWSSIFVSAGGTATSSDKEVDPGNHKVEIKWYDADTDDTYSKPLTKYVGTNDRIKFSYSLDKYLKGKIYVKLFSYDDDDNWVDIYIDDSYFESVQCYSGGTKYSGDKEVTGNQNHKVEVIWWDDDTNLEYKKSDTKHVSSDSLVRYDFNIDEHLSSVSIHVENVDGSSEGSAPVLRYDSGWNPIDSDVTDSGGWAYWPPVDDGTYNFEVYNYYDEFWGDFSLTVGNSGPVTYYFTRFMPHAYEITTSKDSISYGEVITVTVKVKNPSALSRSVRVRVIIDRSKGGDWDHESGTKQTSIASGDTASFDFSWIPDEGGTYYVWTIVETYLTGPAKWVLTDHWEWYPQFTVQMPGHLRVKLTSYDDDYHTVNVYIDDELWGFVDSHPDQTTYSEWRDVEPNKNYVVKIVWHDDDTGADYEKSSTKYIGSDQYVEYPFTIDLHTGWVAVTGQLSYIDDQGNPQPVDAALVELYDEDWEFDDWLDSVYTTSEGLFVLGPVENVDTEIGESGTRDLYVKVKAENWAVNMIGLGALHSSTYGFRTPTVLDVPDGEDEWTVGCPATIAGAFNIFTMITKGTRYVDLFDTTPPKVTAKWYPGYDPDPTHYSRDGTIHIQGIASDPDEWDDSVILHEYGHFIMHKYSDALDSPQNNWKEGWAQFFQAPIRDYLGYVNPEIYVDEPNIQDNLETWTTIPDDYNWIASVLWDIYDAADDDQDTDGVGDELSMGFDEIWDVLVNYDPDPSDNAHNNPWNIHEFWDGWFARGHGHRQKMWALFYEHGISKDATVPDVEILSPSDGATITTSTIEVTWTGSDDTSGMDRYEIRLGSGSWVNIGLITSYTFSGVTEGFHTVEVKAIDKAGLENTDSHSFNVILLDGEITDYVVLTPIVIAGEKLRVEVTVENIGVIRAEYNVYIGNIWDSEGASAGNAYSESHQIIQLDPGGSQILTLEWTTPDTMLPGVYTGDLHLQIAKPGSGWEKHKEYPNVISFTVEGKKSPVTIDPNGGRIYVDGSPITVSTTYQWVTGSNHNLDPDSEYSPSIGTKLIFTQWSDGSVADPREIIIASTSVTYTAQWATHYRLSITVNPIGAGWTTPTAGPYWYSSGTPVVVVETPNPRYAFDHWRLGVNDVGEEASYTIIMDTPYDLTAVFRVKPQVDLLEFVSSTKSLRPEETVIFSVKLRNTAISSFTYWIQVRIMSAKEDSPGWGVIPLPAVSTTIDAGETKSLSVNWLVPASSDPRTCLAILFAYDSNPDTNPLIAQVNQRAGPIFMIDDPDISYVEILGVPDRRIIHTQIQRFAYVEPGTFDYFEWVTMWKAIGAGLLDPIDLAELLMRLPDQYNRMVNLALDKPYHLTIVQAHDKIGVAFEEPLTGLLDGTMKFVTIEYLKMMAEWALDTSLGVLPLPPLEHFTIIPADLLDQPVPYYKQMLLPIKVDTEMLAPINHPYGRDGIVDLRLSATDPRNGNPITGCGLFSGTGSISMRIVQPVPITTTQPITQTWFSEVSPGVYTSSINILNHFGQGFPPDIESVHTGIYLITFYFNKPPTETESGFFGAGDQHSFTVDSSIDGMEVYNLEISASPQTIDLDESSFVDIGFDWALPQTAQASITIELKEDMGFLGIDKSLGTYTTTHFDQLSSESHTFSVPASSLGYFTHTGIHHVYADATLSWIPFGTTSPIQVSRRSYEVTITVRAAASMSIEAHSPVNILVTDPLSRQVGYDPIFEDAINEISGATYSGSDSQPQIIVIPNVFYGDYTVEVFCTGSGLYEILVNSSSTEGLIIDSLNWSGAAEEGQTHIRAVLLYDDGTFDTHPPAIMILSPENTTYTTNFIDLNFTLSEPVAWIGYSLDGQPNVTITGNMVLSGLGQDLHNIVVYANDTYGNMGFSNTVYFTVDTIPPTTSISLSGTLGLDNWYVSDVTVTLTATDEVSGVAVTAYSFDCSSWFTYTGEPFTIINEGITTIYYNSTDNVGNMEYIKSTAVKIDKTNPTITIDLVGTLGNEGWYLSDVTVTLGASDPVSGILIIEYSFDDVTWIIYTTPFTIDTEGTTSVYVKSIDNAGNVETGTFDGKIDKTPPDLTKSFSGTLGNDDWYVSDVTVTLSGSDSVSGLASIQYSFDDTMWYTYSTPFLMSTEGIITLYHKAYDVAGNEFVLPSQQIKIDKTPPTITGAPTTSPNSYGWYNTDVVVHFTATDAISGVDYVTPDQALTSEGADQSVTGTSTDQAGNTAHYTVTGINIDKTPPTITGAATTPPNIYGWYNTDVTVHFTASDSLSGVDYVTPDQIISTEGSDQSTTGTAIDLAGNSATYTVSRINIDKTPPIITGDPTTPANLYGWYNTDVTVHFDATDALSGIATITPDQTLTSEGASQSVTGTATDKAGNSASYTVSDINIDKTPPTITGAPTTSANAHNWYKTDVIVHFEATDSLSGIDAVTPDQTLSAEATDQSITGTATDKAGNSASHTVSEINIDKTPPTITGAPTTPANAHGWYKADVIVHFEASDSLSGLDSVTPDQTLTAEGAGHSVIGTAVDKAGNTASCTVDGINIDKTPPVITGAPTTPANAYDWYNTDVTVHFEASDSLSGILTLTPDTTLSAEGAAQSVTGTAVDLAENEASCTVSGINIDKTPPVISCAPTSPPNAYGWYNTDVTILCTASDSLSGICDPPPIIFLTEEGADQSASCTAADCAGNSASCTVVGINIDKTDPTITGAPTTPSNVHGWYNTDITVHFTAADTISGILTVTPDQIITTEGADQAVTGTATDLAGNSASCTVDGINIDKTPPIITGAPTESANAYDWYNTDVQVHFDASDSLSGLYAVTPDQTLSSEGAGQSVTGTAIDLADNEASYTVSGINIDKTPPLITGAPTTSPNAHDWYNTEVTVHFTASDSLSSLDTVTPDQTLTGEGAGQSVTGVAVDKAGNSASCVVSGINIDKTDPTTSLTIGEPKFGEDPTYVTTTTDFTLEASDTISDVDYTEYKIDSGGWTTYFTPFNVLDFDSHKIYYRSVDIAGNIEDIQSIWIVVNATSISYSGDTNGQYSDAVTVSATLTDMATQQSIEGKTIIFTIGSQTVAATTDSSGVATANIVLDQPVGTYTVSAIFSGDPDYFGCSMTQSFTIQRENAEPEYTGDTVVPTTAKSINLRATLFDSPDGYWGDLTEIQITFSIYAGQLSSTPFMTIPAVPVSQTDMSGIGVAVATIDILPENGYLIIVSIDSNDYYEGPTSDATPLTVYEPTGDFVTGGGWIWDPSGSKGNFGFNAKYTKSGKPKGHSTYVYREDGWNYIVKSNAWIGLAINDNHACFEAKCVVQKYNPATGELVWAEGNYKFRVDVWDNDSDGGVDAYQIRVRDKHGVVYHETGFDPLGELQGGNIVIHDERKKKP